MYIEHVIEFLNQQGAVVMVPLVVISRDESAR